jgi:hypothetical protein
MPPPVRDQARRGALLNEKEWTMKSLPAIALLVLTTSLAAPGASGQAGRASNLTLVGRGRVSAVYDIEAVPPYAYALERGFLRVLDVRNPAAVREVGSLAIAWAPTRMALRAPYLYLTGNGPLGVVDISEPARPHWRGAFPDLTGALGDDFELAGDVAYLVRRDSESRSLWLDVLDIASDPARPHRRGSVDLGTRSTGEYGGIAQTNGRAFVIIERPAGVTNRSELVIVDASMPDTPRIVRTALLQEGKRYHDIDVQGDLLFMLDSSPQKPNGVAVYRLPADRDPELIGEALSPDLRIPIDLQARGDVVYGTFKVGSMLVSFDVSNPSSPKIAASYAQKDRWSAGLGMSLVGERLYVTGDNGPAPIFDISVARAPRLLGRWEYDGGAITDVILDGQLAVLKSFDGMFLYDVSNPGAPKRVGVDHGATPSRSSDFQWNIVVAASGSRAMVAYETLPAQLLDISHPARPVAQGTFTPRGLVHAIVLTPTHAFLAYRAPADGKTARAMDPSSWNGRGGIESVDIRDPRAPHAVGVFTLDAAVTDLARHENRLVAVDAGGALAVVDIRNPDRPAVLGRLAGSGSNGAGALVRPTRVALSADGRLAYVTRTDAAAGTGTLTVVDLSDPATPGVLGRLNLEGSGGTELPLAVDGTRIAVLVGGRDVLIVDAGDPARPVITARHALPPSMFAQGLAFSHDTVFVGALEDGLLIYHVPPLPKGTDK